MKNTKQNSPVRSSDGARKARGSGKRPKSIEDKMLQAVAVYLRSLGWDPFVISAVRVQWPLGSIRDFNYEFIMRFTGAPPKGPAHSPDGEGASDSRKVKTA